MTNQVFIKDISEILLQTLNLSLIFFLILFYFDNKTMIIEEIINIIWILINLN